MDTRVLCLELPTALALRSRPPLKIVRTGLVLVGAGYAVLLFGTGIGTAVAMMALLTLGEILYKSTATAYVSDQAPEHAQGRFQSLYAGVSVSGVILSPPLGGALYATAPGLLWPACAVLGVGAGAAVLGAGRLRDRTARAPASDGAPHRGLDAETGSLARRTSG